MADQFLKKSIIFRDMRTQREHNTAVRLSISCPSAAKTDSQIHRLKETDLSQKGPGALNGLQFSKYFSPFWINPSITGYFLKIMMVIFMTKTLVYYQNKLVRCLQNDCHSARIPNLVRLT